MANNKNDVFDAFTLADTLRHEHLHWRAPPVASPVLAELRTLARDRNRDRCWSPLSVAQTSAMWLR